MATCPVSVWLRGELIGRSEGPEDLADQAMRTHDFAVQLQPRDNPLLVKLEQVGIGHVALAFGLRVETAEKAVKVALPTVTQDPAVAQERQALERAYQSPYLARAVVGREDAVKLICPDDTPMEAQTVMRVETVDGWIYGEMFGKIGKEATIEGLSGLQLPHGAMQGLLMPPHEQFYEHHLRARRGLPFWVVNRPYALATETPYEDRLVEALREAARESAIFGELAQMAAGWWDALSLDVVRSAARRVAQRTAACLPDLLGLISIHTRYAQHEKFPAGLLPEVEAAILGFDYQPGPEAGCDLNSDANQVLLHACRILAGQRFAGATFAASSLTGQQERERGEEAATAWLRTRGQHGFGAWRSHTDLIVAALAHLVDLAEDDLIADLAAVLLDKTLFSIAIHSFRGAFAAPRADAQPIYLRSTHFAPETAISRLLWGMGSYQAGMFGAISLILAGESYQLPAVIHAIASDVETAVWAAERHTIAPSSASTLTSALTSTSTSASASAPAVNTVAYRTADFMLASAQDYRPGERGRREHIWQATMGSEALVFTNHPTTFSQSESRDAGWWRGNGSLPRVAQWKDALIALYDLPEGDRLGFTHAYFPLYAFDEHLLEAGWAFARVEDAYLAIAAAPGFALMQRGPDAFRELRATGSRCVWLCQMGARDADASFENFRRRVLASPPVVEGLHVTWQTIRGDRLEFDWTGPLRLNDAEQPITGFKHHESIYGVAELPAETMDIVYGQDVMRLNFA
jgi:hypothetical protein